MPLPDPALPGAWRRRAGWSIVPVAGEIAGRLGRGRPGRGAYVAVGWQGFLRELAPGEPRRRDGHRGRRPILRRADLVGVSHHDVPRETAGLDARARCSIPVPTC